MAATPATALRELDRRRNDGIEVRLLWDPQTDRVSLSVMDEHSGEALTFEVGPGEALPLSITPTRTRMTNARS